MISFSDIFDLYVLEEDAECVISAEWYAAMLESFLAHELCHCDLPVSLNKVEPHPHCTCKHGCLPYVFRVTHFSLWRYKVTHSLIPVFSSRVFPV